MRSENPLEMEGSPSMKGLSKHGESAKAAFELYLGKGVTHQNPTFDANPNESKQAIQGLLSSYAQPH
jgi:hypothetical protein